ncbi:hypothetical protein CANARDRAFT_8219 [[Candida] arabinofermentans NRRL YB-2248]|uniref:Cytochrome P450 n=1 Tax=[Candida] arabinofermentans NRRL YB-2248 TaxID=983967 RepID=A0A1E4T055_9ASCO|nr:hypothetical protein CANARDRAFT_8219 [[Candida] arabinofermentans NRRL YB-2248]
MLLDLLKLYHDEVVTCSLVLFISYSIYSFFLYPLFFHPLSKIPGPSICALTKYWILYQSWSENRNRYVDALHLKYGPIVRIGPSEVDISDADYLKDIYVNNFDKSSFYAQFGNYGSLNTFSTIDKLTHKNSRKVSAKFYSKSNVMSDPIQSKIRTVMSSLLKVLDENQDKELNVFYLWSMLAMDGVNSFSFGAKHYIPLLADPFNLGKTIIDNFLHQSSSWFWTTQLPQFYKYVVPKTVGQSGKIVQDWIEEQFEESLNAPLDGVDTLVSTILKSSKPNMFDKLRAKSEAFDHIAAGHNTTATTLSYLYYELAKDPSKQLKLINELKKFNSGELLSTKNFNSLDFSQIEDLPYLSALANETFRKYAAIPGQEPRIVPPSGLQWRGSKQTPSAYIPGGTTVTMQPWSLHRIPEVFPDPETFNPDRWLIDDEEHLKIMHKHMFQFGAGSRMCMGMHLAICEIKLSVANVFSRYEVSLSDTYDYNECSMKDIYTTIPGSRNVPIVFKSINLD